MGMTNFVPKKYLDSLSHTEINAVYDAINNLEAALNIIPGTTIISLSGDIITSLDASKLISSSDAAIRRLTLSEDLTVNGNAIINGLLTFGTAGGIKVYGQGGLEVLKIGLYNTDSYGMIATDGTNVNLLVDNNGAVTVRGIVNALNGSQFVGEVTATSGLVLGALTVGGPTGVVLDGATKQITVNSLGKIVAGTNQLTSTGITFNQGTIDIGTKFHVDATGKLTATDVDVTGRIVVTSGNFEVYAGIMGGATIGGTSIYVGGSGPTTTGWSLGADGNIYAKKVNVTGTVNITSGTITGNVVMSGAGKLTLPGVTFSSTGPNFTTLNLSLGAGRFNLNNGYLNCTDAIVTGNIYLAGGNVQGQVTIGNDQSLKFDGLNKRIVAGSSILNSSGITFKQGSIMLGTGTNGPTGDQKYRFYLSSNGTLSASDVSLQGSFTGTLNVTGGKIASWLFDDVNFYAENTLDATPTGTPGEIDRSYFVMANGALMTYNDRSALGGSHLETVAAKLDKDGLLIPNGHINVVIANDGNKKVVIDNAGISSRQNEINRVTLDGGGIRCFLNGLDIGYIITPTGLEVSALKDHSIKLVKWSNIAPKAPTGLSVITELIQTYSDDLVNATISWVVPTEKTDGSTYDDPEGFRIYLKEINSWNGYPRIEETDYRPDFPEISDPEDPNYNIKTFRLNRLKPSQLYMIGIKTVDRLGNESSILETTFPTPGDLIAPAGVIGFEIHAGIREIVAQWGITDEKDFLYYEIERCDSFDDIIYDIWQPFKITSDTFFVDRNVELFTYYKYRIRAVDRNQHESQWYETREGVQPLEVTSDYLANDITIRGDFGLNTPGIGIDMDDLFLGIYSVTPAATPTTPTTPTTPATPLDDATPVTPDAEEVTPTTPVDVTPTIQIPKGIAARNIYVGGDYSEWPYIFSDTTPTLILDNSPGNVYVAKDVYVGGTIKATNIQGTIIEGIDILDLQINIGLLQNAATSLRSDVTVLQGISSSLITDVIELQNDTGSLRTDLTTLENDNLSIHDTIGIIQTSIGTIQNDVGILQTNVGVLQTDVSNLQSIVGNAQSDITSLEIKVESLQSNMVDLQADLTALELAVTPLLGATPTTPVQQITISRGFEVSGPGGIASGVDHLVPNNLTYQPGTNNILIFLDGRLLLPSEYIEINNTTVEFLVDIPQGSYLVYVIFNI